MRDHPPDNDKDVFELLAAIEAGDLDAASQLLPILYNELRRLAAARIASESPGQSLQATDLVHEAYLRLVGDKQADCWNGRGHFFGAAAQAMRRILVDRARNRQALKRGGDHERIDFHADFAEAPDRDEKLIALDDALCKLGDQHPSKAKLVELRFFAGMTNQQAAEQLGISTATATREWAYARAWLRAEMENSHD